MMGAIPPHIAITWQPRSVYEPGKRGVPSARPSTTISSDTCKPMTQPLSPAAQAVRDAVLATYANNIPKNDSLWNLERASTVAALRAAAARLPDYRASSHWLEGIATELEGHQ
jgi:hypothetical protein